MIQLLITDLFTGAVLEELEFKTGSYTRANRVPGGWSATMSHRARKLAVTPGLLEPWTRGAFFLSNGQPLFGGILQTKSTDPSNEDGLDIGGEGFFSYYRDRRRSLQGVGGMIYATLPNKFEIRFDQVDQFNIVKDLLDHAADYAGEANIGYDEIRFMGPLPGGLTGRLRDRSYYTYELKEIGEAIEQLSEVIDGFEFSESYEWDANGNRIKRYFELWYPRKTQDIVFRANLQFDIKSLTRDEVGDELATRVIAQGSGDADAKLTATAVASDLEHPAGPYPMMEAITTYDDVIEIDTLQGHADKDLSYFRYINDTLETELMQSVDFKLGAVDWGDRIAVRMYDGDLQIDDVYRIESLSVDLDEGGAVKMKPSLAFDRKSFGI